MIEKIVSGATVGAAVFTSAVVIGQAKIESKSMFADSAQTVEAPTRLGRDFKHNLMMDHILISGKVIAQGEPMHGQYGKMRQYGKMKAEFRPYTFKTESGKEYKGAFREQNPLSLGDDVTVLLGWPLDCECESSPRIIEAYQK